MSGVLSPEERAILFTHNLKEKAVQLLLAGFLQQELRHVHNVDIPIAELRQAFAAYIVAVETMLAKAEAAYIAQRKTTKH